MGLDMYAYAAEKKDGMVDKDTPAEQIHYWRKHNALHGWMENHFKQMTYQEARELVGFAEEEFPEEGFNAVQAEEFNLTKVPLSLKAIEDLETAIKESSLQPKGGFFFGSTDYDPAQYMEDDLLFITKAKQAIAEGKLVYYDSWW